MSKNCSFSIADLFTIAGSHFDKFSFHDCVDISVLNNFFSPACFSPSDKEIKDVELAVLLLASADKVSRQQLDHASKILKLCEFLSSNTGSSVQRTVHYFSKALREKINRETGAMTSEVRERKRYPFDLYVKKVCLSPASIECYQKIPYIHASKFAGIQAIVDCVATERKVHIIDLMMIISNAGEWVALMQALSSRNEVPLELLKVTTVVTKLMKEIEETGKKLACFAEALSIPFSFMTAVVPHIKDINETMFNSNDGEVTAIFSWVALRRIIARPDCLESVIRILKNLNPCLMVVTECESNDLSPVFMERFSEALSFYSTAFDWFGDSMDPSDPNRADIEGAFLGGEIQNIVAAKDNKRILRHMKLDAWRTCLTKFGLVETGLSSSTLYQAELVAKQYASGNSCTCNLNQKALIINWKGTPLSSLSAWKFQ